MRPLLHPYLDGELDTRDVIEIQAHLEGCADCTALFRNEKLYLDMLKASLRRVPAPSRLPFKVKQALDKATERKQSAIRFWRVLVPTFAVSLIVLVASVLLVRQPTVPGFVIAAVTAHEQYAAHEVSLEVKSSDPRRVSSWLRERAGFTVALGQSPVKNLKLMGGTVLPIQGKKAVLLAYDVDGRPLSLVMTTADGVELFGSQEMIDTNVHFYQSSYHGLQTMSWTLEGMAYVFVSDSQDKNRQACQICHGTGRLLQSAVKAARKLI
ncbi:MAG: zf-HC2 domain-containing protein [Nitrospirota bacterium]